VRDCLEFVKRLLSKYRLTLNKSPILFLVIVILFISFLQVLAVESIQRKSILAVIIWFYNNYKIFFLNYFLTFLLNLSFIAFWGSLRKAVFCSTICLIIVSLANLVKMQLLGEPLYPWDFVRLDQALNLLPSYFIEISSVLSLLFLIILGIIFIVKLLLPKYKVKLITRIAMLFLVVIVTPLLIFYCHTPFEAALKKADYWSPSENVMQNGLLLGFIMDVENIFILKPDNYDMKEIVRIAKEYQINEVEDDVEKPNIIVMLNESFWDPTVLPNLAFSEDPISFFRETQAKYISGYMVSPVFGGSTANVEFEILTGLSTGFLPHGVIAYQQFVTKPVPAIPGILKANGYACIAVHPYHEWFYKRDQVYQYLGFDKFYSLKDFEKAEVRGEYVADLEVSKKIISIVKETEEPSFIFAVTMQNHGPYPKNRYKGTEKKIKIESKLSPEGQEIVNTYIQGLYDADKALKYLIENLEKIDEPTAIVFLGDHLPYLGKDYLVYKETGYISENEKEWSDTDKLKMKSVPYIIWANYEINKDKIETNSFISAQFIGNYILDLGNVPYNLVFRFTNSLKDVIPVFSNNLKLSKDSKAITDLLSDFEVLENDYRLLQYDLLFGEQYSSIIKNYKEGRV